MPLELVVVPSNAMTRAQASAVIELCSQVFQLDYAFYMELPYDRVQGHGSAIMRRLQYEVGGYDLGALSPRRPEWYERLGWVRWQGPLFILKDADALETPDECVMVMRTPHSGEIDIRSPLTGEWRPFELW